MDTNPNPNPAMSGNGMQALETIAIAHRYITNLHRSGGHGPG